ncbi:MAG: DoxX family protein [Saprospiraceae bacterium]|nr:DoxX family protein [Lewinella sp.]
MKTTRIIYWITTGIIFLWEGVMPALTTYTELAKEGISHLGYPGYFLPLLTVFKVLGSLALILPMVKGPIKEWAYAGLGFVFISATVSHWAVDGFSAMVLFPVFFLGMLVISHITYHRLKDVSIPLDQVPA